MSRQLISRADSVFNGRATFAPYQADKPGQQVHLLYRWKPERNLSTTFTAGIAAGATSGTLSANWAGATGLFPITFSDAEVLMGKFLNGNTAVTFYPASAPATGGSYGALTGPVNAVTSAITVGQQPPVVGVANFYSVSASIGSGATAVLAATVPDVPRNVVGAWTGTAIATVVGTDYWGQTQSEVSASGTTLATKKTFASITSITMSAAVTAATFGTGNVLGLPFHVRSICDFFASVFDTGADAGTLVAADLTNPATTSTGDVRGTYTPAGTLNGAKFLAALIKVYDNTNQVGSFGVTPA